MSVMLDTCHNGAFQVSIRVINGLLVCWYGRFIVSYVVPCGEVVLKDGRTGVCGTPTYQLVEHLRLSRPHPKLINLLLMLIILRVVMVVRLRFFLGEGPLDR